MVGEKGLAAAAWSQDKFVAVGDDAPFHRKVGNVHAVSYTHLDVYKRQRVHHPGGSLQVLPVCPAHHLLP